jgi:nitrogen fixation protein FixH
MKLSWGYRVTILYISFALFIIFFVTRSMHQQIDLVAPDYYAKELAFQTQIENSNNNNALTGKVEITYVNEGVRIQFPSDFAKTSLSGKMHLFRPSDKQLDREYEIQTDHELSQIIPSHELKKGLYRLKVEYTDGNKNYYCEKQIVINR